MFFKLLITFFGYAFVYRIYQNQIEKGFLPKNVLKNWLFVTVSVSFFVFFKFFGSDFAYWITFSTSMVLLHVTIFVTRTKRECKFREEFLSFMDRLVLQMQSGRSFRTSLQISNEFTSEFYKPKLEKIIENVLFAKNTKIFTPNDLICEILEQFFLIDQFPHRSLQRVLAFRHQLKIQDEIRRKSGQKQRQLKVQSYILSFLYLSTVLFLFFNFDWRKNILIMLISFTFFITGTFLVHKMARGNLWKI